MAVVFETEDGSYFQVHHTGHGYYLCVVRVGRAHLRYHVSPTVESDSDLRILTPADVRKSYPNLHRFVSVLGQLGAFGAMGNPLVTDALLGNLDNMFGGTGERFWENLECTFDADGHVVLPD